MPILHYLGFFGGSCTLQFDDDAHSLSRVQQWNEHKERPTRETCYTPPKHTGAIYVKQGAECGEYPKKVAKTSAGLFIAVSIVYLIKNNPVTKD